ncbi:MAG: hypothetical protein QW641_03190 [Candidatus Aenigmatarchaeota archaeon]
MLGDAGSQVKPYSAGGFTYAAIATEIAVEATKKAFNQNDFSKEFFKENYEKLFPLVIMLLFRSEKYINT